MDIAAIVQELKALQVKKCISLCKILQEIGITRTTYDTLRSGARETSLATIGKIVRYLKNNGSTIDHIMYKGIKISC